MSALFVTTLLLTLLGSAAQSEEITNALGMKLRLLEAGRFERGERDLSAGFHKDHTSFNVQDERPVHPVVLTKPFYLASTEVTVAQFRQFVEETGYQTSAEKNERGAVGWDPTPPEDNPRYVATFRDGGGFNWKNPGFEQQDDHPVVCVSYADAQAFCRWLSEKENANYRLPTEAEWEYAARAGTDDYFSFGNEYRGVIHRHGNIGNVELEKEFPDRVRRQWLIDVEKDPGDGQIFTAPVGSYQANAWGIADMHGNVWEWCADRYLDTAYSPYDRPGHQQIRKRAIDPFNEEKWNNDGDWNVIRGGSWFNAPIQCRSAIRGFFEAEDAACYIGFRVARDAPDQAIAEAKARFEASEAARETILRLVDRVQERRDGKLTLTLRRENLGDELFDALAQLDEPVDIHLNGNYQLTPDDIANLAKAKQLTGLVLSQIGEEVTNDDLSVLADHPELELLELTGAAKLTDDLFGHLSEHMQLQQLRFDAVGITDDGLSRLPALKKLEKLQLRGTASRGLVLERFAGSPLGEFSCGHLNDEAATMLSKFDQLRVLEMQGSPLTGRGLAALAQLPWVNRLYLSGCGQLTDADIAVVGNLYELSSLSLDGTAAGDAAVEGIARLNHLRDLHIGSPQLTDAGVRNICSLVSLHHLTLAGEAEKITDAGLADLWRLANLRSFSFAAPQITGSGLATLQELPYLERVNANGMGITDIAMKHMAASETLRQTFIGSWDHGGPPNLTDEGLLHLGDAKSLTQVDLRLGGTKVTDDGLEALKAKRADLKVNLR